MLGAHLGLHLASVVAWRFHQHQVPSFSKDPFQSSHGWSGWSTICDLMLDRNSIVDSNGSRLFSAGRPLGTRKNSVHCLWFLCCCTQTLHRTPFGTSSYFTHRHLKSGPPFFLIWSLPRLWYGSLSGSIYLNHLSICYNSLVLITLVFRSSCRITYIYIKVWNNRQNTKRESSLRLDILQ